jgi:hypothetical protein
MVNLGFDAGIHYFLDLGDMNNTTMFAVDPSSYVKEGATDSNPTQGSSSSSSTSTPTSTTTAVIKSFAREAGDAAIMAATLAAGQQMARKVPTLAGKAGVLGGSVVLGYLAITAKNVTSNLTQNVGRPNVSNSLVSVSTYYDKVNTQIMGFYNLTDDYLLSFLKLISFIHQLQWFFVLMIGYYAILLYVPIEKIESYYYSFLSKRIAEFVIKSIARFKKVV